MQGNTELELDQLWYTFSKNGLGSTSAVGYRVRAASPGLYNLQDMRYRLVDRFLPYALPQGINPSEFNARIAPISLSFVNNGTENLLIRKVFVGRDYAGRNSVFFTHLIAGLPRDFTARDAIRLWYCPELWVESEQGKASNGAPLAANETSLEKIPYSKILSYVQKSQTSFNFAPIQEPLQNLLLLILSRGLPSRIYVRGQSTLIAALIYGLTHALPLTLLSNLTFTTYESETTEGESTVIQGTISGAELQDATGLQVQPGFLTGPIPADLQHYVTNAVASLMTGNSRFTKLIEEMDTRNNANAEDLIQRFKRLFRIDPLTFKQLEDIVLHPADNLDDLLDPGTQQEGAQLLLSYPKYWEEHGQKIFSEVASWLAPGSQTRLDQQTRAALAAYLNGMNGYIFTVMQTELMQGTIPQHSTILIGVLAHPSNNPSIYLRMLTEFAQGPIYAQITSDALWPFHIWLLKCAKLMKPQPTQEQMQPWLHIPSWEKLDKVLKLDLPAEWEYPAMFEQLKRKIPIGAIPVVKTNEAKFTSFMKDILQQGCQNGNQGYIDAIVGLFRAIIYWDEQEHSFPKRARLLLVLANTVPNDSRVIELLFSTVSKTSPYQLTDNEFDTILAEFLPEVIATRSSAPSLMVYLREFILSLTPKKLKFLNTLTLLKQFQQSNVPAENDSFSFLVNSWLVISQFLARPAFDIASLLNIKPALEFLIPQLQQRQDELHQERRDICSTFLEEMVPDLLSAVETEHQLESVLEVFETAQVAPKWYLLNAMAVQARTIHPQDLSRLTPYLLCGIREYARIGLSQEKLDTYLQTLYGQNDNAIRNVDMAVSSGVWPELIQREWKGLRERTKTSLGTSIKNIFIPPPQRPQSGQGQSGRQNVPATWQPGQPGFSMQQSTHLMGPPTNQQQLILSSPQGQINTPETIIATLIVRNKSYKITPRIYRQLHQTLIELLPYWIKVLSEKMTTGRSNAIAFEVSTTRTLLDGLQHTQTTAISEGLIYYYARCLLIVDEVEQLRKAGDQSALNFLNPSNHINTRLTEFQKSVGMNTYQNLCNNYTEQAIIDTLSWLILRYHFFQNMDIKKKEWEKWLGKERKDIKVEYHTSQILF